MGMLKEAIKRLAKRCVIELPPMVEIKTANKPACQRRPALRGLQPRVEYSKRQLTTHSLSHYRLTVKWESPKIKELSLHSQRNFALCFKINYLQISKIEETPAQLWAGPLKACYPISTCQRSIPNFKYQMNRSNHHWWLGTTGFPKI